MRTAALRQSWPLWLVLLLALAVRLWGITFGLPGLDHGDEPEVVNHAVRFGGGDLNPHRFQYGALVQYLLFFIYGLYFAGGYVLGAFRSVHDFALSFVRDPSVFYLIGRIFSALAGSATVFVAYLVGRRLAGRGAGLLAAGFLALCHQSVVHSHYATVDTALAFFFTLAAHRCLVLYDTGAARDYILAGLFAGFACAVKFNGVFALMPLLCAHVLRARGGSLEKLFYAASAAIAGLALGNPFSLVEFSSVVAEIRELDAMHQGGLTAGYLRLLIGPELWGLPLGLACLWGVVSSFWRDRRHAIIALGCIPVLAFVSRYRYVEAKYILYIVPLLAALGASAIMGLVRSERLPVIAGILAAACFSSGALILDWDRAHAGQSINLEARRWIEHNIPPRAKVLLDNTGNGGPKLDNDPANVLRQYERAAATGLMKAEYLKLAAELRPEVYYNIVLVDEPAGSRHDDYEQWRSWQDLEKIGMPARYYRERGFDYVIVTGRYFEAMGSDFELVKEFARDKEKIRIYKVPPA